VYHAVAGSQCTSGYSGGVYTQILTFTQRCEAVGLGGRHKLDELIDARRRG